MQQTPIGRILDDRYRVEAQVGAGGVGAVYRATHLKLGHQVAVKLLLEHYGQHEALRRRFEREAKALAALAHPNIVTVTDYGLSGDTPYLVMELLEGETLARRLAPGPIASSVALSLTRDLLRALAFVHDSGLVHRDLKPGNVFLQRLPDGNQRLKLLDFGLAKFIEDDPDRKEQTLTQLGTMMGTPAYMAPEQIGGDPADARTDVYAIGVILFEMLCGRRPFEGETAEMLRGHLTEPVPRLSQVKPGIMARPELDALLQRAMAKERTERFQDAAQMLRALEAVPQPWLLAGGVPEEDPRVSNTISVATTVAAKGADSRDESGGHAGRGGNDSAHGIAVSLPATDATPTRLHDKPASGVLATVRQTLAGLLAAGARVLTITSLLAVAVAGTVLYVMLSPERAHERSTLEHTAEQVAPKLEAIANATARLQHELSPDAGSKLTAATLSATGDAAKSGAAAAAAPSATAPAAPSTESPSVPTKNVPRVAARNPWARPVPKDLRPVRKAIVAGEYGSDRAITLLRKYSAAHPDDARGQLLLARMYQNRHWPTEEIAAYVAAYQHDPSCRAAAHMLADCLEVVAQGDAADRASRFVYDAYGNEALPMLDRMLLSTHSNEQALARLRALRARIASH